MTPRTEKSQALVAEKIALLIEEFGLFLVDREGQKIDNLLTHYAANVPLCIHYAVILPTKYQILDTLYELFAQDPMALTVFLSSKYKQQNFNFTTESAPSRVKII